LEHVVNNPEPEQITDLLKRVRTIAVVGLSDSPLRSSHGVAAYLQMHGYRIIPVNPTIQEALGEKAYPTLQEIPPEEQIDLVDIFRRSEHVPPVVEQAIQRRVPAVWMQETVMHDEAAEKAREAGMLVVMDRCILKEHRQRHF
jgi:predicted CoA-binding protein